jgi:hypothetical protein
VYAELEGDPQTKDIIDGIRQLKQVTPVANTTPHACGEDTTTVSGSDTAGPGETADFFGGSYRLEHTMEGLMALGVGEEDAFNHAGVWTFTVDDEGAFKAADGCTGRFVVSEGRFALHFNSEPGCGTAKNSVIFTAAWTFDGDSLMVVDLEGGTDDPTEQTLLEAVFASSPWEKID